MRAANTLRLKWEQWFLRGLDPRTSIDQWQAKLETFSLDQFYLLSVARGRGYLRFAGLEKSSLNFSSSSFVILVPLWFIIITLVFFYLCKLLFSVSFNFKVTEFLCKCHAL